MSEPYEQADHIIALLRKRAVKKFEKARKKAALLGFDELNVISIVNDLYADLEKDNEKAFLQLAELAYKGAIPHGSKAPGKKWLDELLKGYDPVLLYVYLHEVERKRDRMAEGVNASKNKANEFKKGLTYWHRMTAWECDNVEYQANLKALKDSGVRKVKWVAVGDERTCMECRELDGKIYQIDKVPSKPHPGCRCWLTRAD